MAAWNPIFLRHSPRNTILFFTLHRRRTGSLLTIRDGILMYCVPGTPGFFFYYSCPSKGYSDLWVPSGRVVDRLEVSLLDTGGMRKDPGLRGFSDARQDPFEKVLVTYYVTQVSNTWS